MDGQDCSGGDMTSESTPLEQRGLEDHGASKPTPLEHRGSESLAASEPQHLEHKGSVGSTWSYCSGVSSPPSDEVEAAEKLERWKQRRRRQKERQRDPNSWNYGRLTKAMARRYLTADDVSRCLMARGLEVTDLQLIGEGRFAQVFKGFYTSPQELVVIKCIRDMVCTKPTQVDVPAGDAAKDGASKPLQYPTWLLREVEINKVQHHRNVVRILEALLDDLPYIMVFEYCAGGSLHSVLHGNANVDAYVRSESSELSTGDVEPEQHRLTWKQRITIALDVACGMEHLHAKQIIHRDLRPENVMLLEPIRSAAEVPHAKVGDFGLARLLPSVQKSDFMTSEVGSVHYMAPELFSRSEEEEMQQYDEKADVYSYAVLLSELSSDQLPFSGTGVEDAMRTNFIRYIVNGGRPKVSEALDNLPTIRSLMTRSWEKDSTKRPSFEWICTELQQVVDNLPVDSWPLPSAA